MSQASDELVKLQCQWKYLINTCHLEKVVALSMCAKDDLLLIFLLNCSWYLRVIPSSSFELLILTQANCHISVNNAYFLKSPWLGIPPPPVCRSGNNFDTKSEPHAVRHACKQIERAWRSWEKMRQRWAFWSLWHVCRKWRASEKKYVRVAQLKCILFFCCVMYFLKLCSSNSWQNKKAG